MRHKGSKPVRLSQRSYKQECLVCGATRFRILTDRSELNAPWELEGKRCPQCPGEKGATA